MKIEMEYKDGKKEECVAQIGKYGKPEDFFASLQRDKFIGISGSENGFPIFVDVTEIKKIKVFRCYGDRSSYSPQVHYKDGKCENFKLDGNAADIKKSLNQGRFVELKDKNGYKVFVAVDSISRIKII